MKIIDKNYDKEEVLEVYAVYNVDDGVNLYCSPKGYEALMVFSLLEVDIVEPYFKDKIYIKLDEENKISVFHWAIFEDDLYIELFEHDPDAYAEFVRRLGREP